MAELDAPPVASSATDSPEVVTALDQAVAANDVAVYRAAKAAQRSQTPAAASSAASPDDPAASTEVSVVASEATPPAKKGADARKAELKAEIDDLLRQRADLRRELTPPPPAPDATLAASSPAPGPTHGKPSWDDFEAQIGTTFTSWGQAQNAFQDARDAWKDAQTAQERQMASERSRLTTVAETWKQAVDEVTKDAPEFWSTVPGLADCVPLSVARLRDPRVVRNATHDIAEVMVTSQHQADWLRHFASHPDTFATLRQSPSPEALYREMGRIEATFAGALPPSVPKPPTVTRASAPPTMLGSKPTTPASDDAMSAVARDDVAGYRAVRLRERLATLR